LMIAQDTGSAIIGPARADLYWGAGDDAGRIAGRIRHPGRFVMLLPRELDMVAAGKLVPLPVPKPAIPDVQSQKENGRPKGQAVTSSEVVPLPVPKPTMQDVQIQKENGKLKQQAGAPADVVRSSRRYRPARWWWWRS
jgi:membrane-bound lytic murein transglycosylase A